MSSTASRSRIPRWAWILALCLGVMFLALVLAIAIPAVFISRWFAEGERQLEEEVALLEKRSEPATPEELDAYYRLPAGATDTTNLWVQAASSFAGPEFDRASKDLPVVGLSEAPITDPGQPWEELDAVRALLVAYRPAMEQMHEAARRGGAARYESRFQDGMAADTGILQELRAAARMLKLEAHVKAHDGDSDGALRSINTILRLSQSLQGYPQTIQQLVRIAIAGIAYDTLTLLLPYLDLDDDDLRNVMDDLSDDDYDQGLLDMLLGERVNGLHAFDHPEVAMEGLAVDSKKLQQWSRDWMKRDRAYSLRQMRRLINASQEPRPQKLMSAKRVGDEVHRFMRDGNKFLQVQYIVSGLLLSVGDAMFNATARAIALRDGAIVTLAIERYRKRNGEPPMSLNDLAPEYVSTVPLDPFDGRPLRYRVESDRYFVYSVGENLRDDGGDAGPDGDLLDLVLSVKLVD